MLNQKLMGNPAERQYVDDVFSTYLYTGNGSTQTINNGIDLAGEGGLVWLKARATNGNHVLCDTARGNNNVLYTNETSGSDVQSVSLTSSGFSLGSSNLNINQVSANYASWTFRRAPKFFDVVTYTGNGVAGRQIAHGLGCEPGMIVVKATNAASTNWAVYHRALTTGSRPQPGGNYLFLNTTQAVDWNDNYWNNTNPTSSVFTVGAGTFVNNNGTTYVAYLWAHDPSEDGFVQCGSYVGNGSATGPTINLGFEPQFLVVKRATGGAGNWYLNDVMRGMSVTGYAALHANDSGAENVASIGIFAPTATGFSVGSSSTGYNNSGDTYIYLAIRRPNKPPKTGAEVFAPVVFGSSGVNSTNFPVDFLIDISRDDPNGNDVWDRLRGSGKFVRTYATDSETSYSNVPYFDSNTSANFNTGWGNNQIAWNFRRAPGFFDMVCYTGTGFARTVQHGLGVVPELMIVKNRTESWSWGTYHKDLGASKAVNLQTTQAAFNELVYWDATTPTSTVFSVGGSSITNKNANNIVAYLFASLPGISKVGSYTGNGTSQTINCGFSSGARFFLVKATSTTGNWWVFDSARGIVSSFDPALALNSTAAEVTSADAVDPFASGIAVNQEATCSINATGVNYIFLAIA